MRNCSVPCRRSDEPMGSCAPCRVYGKATSPQIRAQDRRPSVCEQSVDGLHGHRHDACPLTILPAMRRGPFEPVRENFIVPNRSAVGGELAIRSSMTFAHNVKRGALKVARPSRLIARATHRPKFNVASAKTHVAL